MKNILKSVLLVISILITTNSFGQFLQQSFIDRQISVTIRGVYSSKISLYFLDEKNSKTLISEKGELKNLQKAIFVVPEKYIPGQFVMKFEYRTKQNEPVQNSEKNIIVNKQDLEIFLNPKYVLLNDSLSFQKGELENTLMNNISVKINTEQEQLGLLEIFLTNYDRKTSLAYKNSLIEFETRRKEYNIWLKEQFEQYKNLYFSHLIQFEYMPEIDFSSDLQKTKLSKAQNFLKYLDFQDTVMLKMPDLQQKMQKYMNIWSAVIESTGQQDSVYTDAGRAAIELASKGHPKVYGWMVDYFFIGYESFNIQSGMKMLEKYMNDPKCLTSKKQEIQRRIEGMKNLQAGSVVPDFTLPDSDNSVFDFYKYQGRTAYKLLLFWSADCPHCEELVKPLYEWYIKEQNKNRIDVVAVSVDETDTEIEKWNIKKKQLSEWKHLIAKEGVNSKVANDYYILSTPVMFIIESKTNKIIGMPVNVSEIEALLK